MLEEAVKNPAADLDNLLSRIGKSINNEAATSANNALLLEQALLMVSRIKEHAEVLRPFNIPQ